ncbi:hypothetical protein AT727_13715 [Desulfitobacterium hafniense]|uniref:Uncharacterized protein n=1 Tax=Desulfitobacterium hafniense TaxID=49338 RepID=A0A0W1JDK3_DESHA|nr:hypothetical protein AT727_13715 [Desulfitobacterium hafniense]
MRYSGIGVHHTDDGQYRKRAGKRKVCHILHLFNPDGIIAGESAAIWGIAVLFVGAIILFSSAIAIFAKKICPFSKRKN